MYELIAAEPYVLMARGSRFLAQLHPATDGETAKRVVSSVRQSHPDATHVVHALVVGAAGGILGCSDDGEPAGTAGRPALEVLRGSRITNVVLTITRWFGGTKLGTGGLVHAYSESARGAVDAAEIREIIPMREFAFTVPFAMLEGAKRLFAECGFVVASGDFGADGYAVSGRIAQENAGDFVRRIGDLSRGRIKLAETPERG